MSVVQKFGYEKHIYTTKHRVSNFSRTFLEEKLLNQAQTFEVPELKNSLMSEWHTNRQPKSVPL